MTIRAVPALTRGIAILRLLGRTRAPMGVKAIADALDLVPSTVLHILRVLVAEELLKVDATSSTRSAWARSRWPAPPWRATISRRGYSRISTPCQRYGVTAIDLGCPTCST